MIRSKHNNLLNYFIFNKKDLSKAYVRKCEKFLYGLKAQASGPVKCPSVPLSCHPHGWPRGNKKYRDKQQAIQETVPYNDIEEATSNDK